MKKNFVVALVAMFVLSIAGTAFAAANPFVDVPAKHWAYEAVSKLAAAGIVDGYGDGTFRGDKSITRYEMAQIVAKAMAKSDKADAQQKAIIDKLAVEFAAELNNLGVRVAKLEKNASAIKIQGESRLDYAWHDTGTNGSKDFGWRQRLHLSAPVTDKITYMARMEATGTFGTIPAADNTASAAKFTRNFFSVKDLFGVNTTNFGRQPIAVGRYTVMGKTDNLDGASLKHAFGKTVVDAYFVNNANTKEVSGINFDYNASKDFVFNAGYITDDSAAASYIDLGFSYVFNPGVSLVGAYVQSDAAGDPSMFGAQLVYNWKSKKSQKGFYGWEKIVNYGKAHDQAIAITYRDIDDAAHPGYSIPFGAVNNVGKVAAGTTTAGTNIKGLSIAYQNAVAKNVLLSIEYYDVESKTGTPKEEKKAYASFEFFF